MKFAQIGSVALHYDAREIASGKPLIVFINSLGTDFRIWDGVVDFLGTGNAYLRYDLRGHGLSDIGNTPYVIADLAGDLAGLMDHLGCKKALICGLSVGGQIAQQLYFDRPDLVSGLIFCDTAAQIGSQEFWQTRSKSIQMGGLQSITDSVMQRWFGKKFREEGGADFAGCRSMFLRQPEEGYLATCHAVNQFDRRADAAKIAVPVTCVVGSEDDATPPEMVEAFAASIPGARFEILEGAGHLPCVEQPQRLGAIIRSFLQQGGDDHA